MATRRLGAAGDFQRQFGRRHEPSRVVREVGGNGGDQPFGIIYALRIGQDDDALDVVRSESAGTNDPLWRIHDIFQVVYSTFGFVPDRYRRSDANERSVVPIGWT